MEWQLVKKYLGAIVSAAVEELPGGKIVGKVIEVWAEEDDESSETSEQASLRLVFETSLGPTAPPVLSDSALLGLKAAARLAFPMLSERERKSVTRKAKLIEVSADGMERDELVLELCQELSEQLFQQASFKDAATGLLSGASARQRAARLAPKTVVAGCYEIEEWLGGGGFGDVYRAQDRRFASRCALKLLTATGAEVEARFRREGQTGFRLGRNLGLVQAYDMMQRAPPPTWPRSKSTISRASMPAPMSTPWG